MIPDQRVSHTRETGQLRENMATAIEYGLIAALVSVAAITAFTTVGTKLSSMQSETEKTRRFEPDVKVSLGGVPKYDAGGACVKFTGANEHDDFDAIKAKLVGQPVPGIMAQSPPRILLVHKGAVLGCGRDEVAVFTIKAAN